MAELLPYTARYAYNMTTILDIDDMEELGLNHPGGETLYSRYLDGKQKDVRESFESFKK